jgi:purine-binding chemotaxis protein CheW
MGPEHGQTGERKQYLGFELAGVGYGISILQVKEILQFEPITKVPSTPPSIRGVINLRGNVIPVVDLAVKFGLAETAPTKWTCILVVEAKLDGDPLVMGLLADSVSEVIDLGPDELEPAPAFGCHVKVEYLLGMGKVGKKLVLLLDIDRVLSAAEGEVAAAISADGFAGAVAPGQEYAPSDPGDPGGS